MSALPPAGCAGLVARGGCSWEAPGAPPVLTIPRGAKEQGPGLHVAVEPRGQSLPACSTRAALVKHLRRAGDLQGRVQRCFHWMSLTFTPSSAFSWLRKRARLCRGSRCLHGREESREDIAAQQPHMSVGECFCSFIHGSDITAPGYRTTASYPQNRRELFCLLCRHQVTSFFTGCWNDNYFPSLTWEEYKAGRTCDGRTAVSSSASS